MYAKPAFGNILPSTKKLPGKMQSEKNIRGADPLSHGNLALL